MLVINEIAVILVDSSLNVSSSLLSNSTHCLYLVLFCFPMDYGEKYRFIL